MRSVLIIVSYPYEQNPVLHKEVAVLHERGIRTILLCWERTEKRNPPQISRKAIIENIFVPSGYGNRGTGKIFHTLDFWIRAVFKAKKYNRSFSLLHCQDLIAVIPGIVIAKLFKKPILFDVHDPYPEMISLTQPKLIVQLSRMVEKVVCRHVDGVLTVNQLMRQRMTKLTRKPITIVYNFPEKKMFENTRKKTWGKPFVVGRIGSIQEGSGMELIVSAIQGLIPRYPFLRLLLVGRVIDSYRGEFSRLVTGIRKHLEIVDGIPYSDVPKYYSKIDVSLAIYDEKGIASFITPMKMFESMAAGVPVIASNVGETKFWNDATRSGIVIQQNSVEQLQKAIIKLIHERKLSGEYGTNGRKAIFEKYNWEAEKGKLIKLYDEML